MKPLVSIFILLILITGLKSQPVKQDLIASAGGSKVNGNISVSWTLGETIVPMFRSANSTVTLTNGFLQQLIVTSVEEPLDISVQVSVFPNPAAENISIRFQNPVDGRFQYSLVDSQGRVVRTGNIEAGESEKQINVRDISGGAYFIRLSKGKITNVYKIIKK